MNLLEQCTGRKAPLDELLKLVIVGLALLLQCLTESVARHWHCQVNGLGLGSRINLGNHLSSGLGFVSPTFETVVKSKQGLSDRIGKGNLSKNP